MLERELRDLERAGFPALVARLRMLLRVPSRKLSERQREEKGRLLDEARERLMDARRWAFVWDVLVCPLSTVYAMDDA